MHRFQHLMVGLTRTEADAGLIRYAAMAARLGTATEVRFVHVLPAPTGHGPAESYDKALHELQSAVHADFADVAAGVRLECEVLTGPLVDRLLTCAAEHEADLLFVGDGPSLSGRRALARRLAMKAPCSVWVVPDGAPARLGRILVPVDFSDPAADALRVAIAMARLSGQAELLALHVYFNEARVTFEEYAQVLRGQEEQAYRQFVAPIDCKGVLITPLFEEGAQVPHVIERVARREGADLVVMATRGRSRSAAILLGSVTEEVLTETRLPLLVVKHFGASMGVLQVLLDRNFRRRRDLQFD